MTSPITYSLINPVTNQSQYLENDIVDLLVNIPMGKEMQKGSLLINGRLAVTVSTVANPLPVPVSLDHKVSLDGNVGVHALFNNWNVQFLGGTQETNTEYGRYVSAVTEAQNFAEDVAFMSDSQAELKSLRDSSQSNVMNYNALLPITNGTTLAGALQNSVPFSFKPLICVNQTVQNIPSSKIKTIAVKVQLEPAYKVFRCDVANVQQISYVLSDLCCSYILVPEQKSSQPLLLERVLVQANNNIVGSMASISNINNAPFTRMFMTFKDSTHSNKSTVTTLTQVSYNYFLNESLPVGIRRVEFVIDSVDTQYSYPLESVDEVLYNYLLCFSPSLNLHGLSLKKLREVMADNQVNPIIPNGFGIGTRFFDTIPMGSSVAVNLELTDSVNDPVQVFTFFMSSVVV
jgi:hypothetical protein